MICPVLRRHLAAARPVALLACLSLAGCMTPPIHLPPVMPLPQAAAQARLAVLATEPALSEDATPSRWWQLFDDPALSSLETLAGQGNLDLQAGLARIEQSRAQLGVTDADRGPFLSASAGYTRSAISENSPLARLGGYTGGSSTWSLGLQAAWELDLWGYLRERSASAQARLEAADFGWAALQVSLSGEVARNYLLLRGVQSRLAIVEQNRAIASDLVRLADSRLRNGVATRFEVASAQADVANIEAQSLQLMHQRDVLMNALALLLGRPPHDLDEQLGKGVLPRLPRQLPLGVSSELAHRRPDILQAEARLRAAVADMGAAQADFYPRIGLAAGLGVQAFERSDLGNWDSRQYSFGPTLHLPIFENGRLKSLLALSEARHREAAIAYRQTVLRAWHEVDDALAAYASERRRHERLEQAQANSRTALDVAQRAYEQGTSDFTAVLVARRSFLASQLALDDSATASALSVVGLYRAVGGGWSPELDGATAAVTRGGE